MGTACTKKVKIAFQKDFSFGPFLVSFQNNTLAFCITGIMFWQVNPDVSDQLHRGYLR